MERHVGGRPSVLQVVRDREARGPAGVQRGVDASGRERGHDAGGVAHEHDVARGEGPDGATDGDQTRPVPHAPRRRQIEAPRDAIEEGLQRRAPGPAAGQADLRDADPRHHPGDVPGGQPRIQEDVESVLDAPHAVELDLRSGEEPAVPTEALGAGDRGARAVGAHEHGRASCRAEGLSPSDVGARALGAARQRAQQPGRLGREEVVAGCVEVHPPQRGTVDADASDLPRELGRWIEDLGRLLDEQPGGADRLAGVALALPDDRPEAARRAGLRACQAREARSHDLDVRSDHGSSLVCAGPRRIGPRRQRHASVILLRQRSPGSRPRGDRSRMWRPLAAVDGARYRWQTVEPRSSERFDRFRKLQK